MVAGRSTESLDVNGIVARGVLVVVSPDHHPSHTHSRAHTEETWWKGVVDVARPLSAEYSHTGPTEPRTASTYSSPGDLLANRCRSLGHRNIGCPHVRHIQLE